jgi:SAM-dependent methyltransferase
MPDRQCLVCGSALGDSRYAGLLQCPTCHFITADVNLSSDELAKLYSEKYFSGEEYSDYIADRPTIQRNFTNRLRVLLRQVPNADRKRLFEIGSAYGFFLDVARPSFKDVAGIDVSADAASYARSELKLNVAEGDFLDHPLHESIDVACMWDTIEHLQSPHLYIEKLSANMPPGATIAITTGDIGSFMARFRGRRWRQIHPPTHLHYFSRLTLERLLNRYGFAVRYCGYDGAYRSLDMIAAILLKVRRKQESLYNLLKKTGLLSFDLSLNLFDIVYMIGEKQPKQNL